MNQQGKTYEPNNAGGVEDFAAVWNWTPSGAWVWVDLPISYPGVTHGIAECSTTPVPVAANPVLIILLAAGIICTALVSKKVLTSKKLS